LCLSMPSSTGENRPMRVSSSTGPETRIGDFSFIDANSLLPTASGCVLSGRRQQPVFRYWDGHRRPRRETCSDSTVQVFALCSRLSFDCHGTSELFPITRQTRRGRSTKLAASSASLRRFRRVGWPRGGRRQRADLRLLCRHVGTNPVSVSDLAIYHSSRLSLRSTGNGHLLKKPVVHREQAIGLPPAPDASASTVTHPAAIRGSWGSINERTCQGFRDQGAAIRDRKIHT